MKSSKQLILNSLLALMACAAGWPIQMTSQNQDLVMTKDLVGGTGNPAMASADYSLALASGEQAAGNTLSGGTTLIISGYFGGRFGNSQTFQLLSSHVGLSGSKDLFQDRLQVGVPFNAPVQLSFSDQLDDTTIPNGIHVAAAKDHLGNTTSLVVPIAVTSDPLAHSVTIQPQAAWEGNTLYDVQITPQLRNIDGSPLAETTHVCYVTLLDIHQENVVSDPLQVPGLIAASGNSTAESMSIHIQAESLPDFSAVLSSRDPLTAPLHVDPQIIRQANMKAQASGGAYRTPLAIQEINAYSTQGDLLGTLSRPAELTISYGSGLGAAGSVLVRPQTLALYVLDESHQLWVKIPASRNAAGFQSVSAPVTRFSVFAAMGSADGSASDSHVYPVPWRPHGPNAGGGPGQTGTEGEGLTFTDLPSECTIKIYTMAGDLVRQIQHSDTGGLMGREPWDAKTAHGEPAASGVYLWRVESSLDGKNGKLLIIR